MYGYRTGAKQEHKNQIREMTLAGVAAEEISRKLMIDINCVRKFCEHFRKQAEKDITPAPQAQVSPDPEPVNEEASVQTAEDATSEEGKEAAPTEETTEQEPEAAPKKKRSVGRPPKQNVQTA